MTARNDDRLLSTWLHDVAPGREPEHLLGEVLARTARTRRRAAWRVPERWNPMSAITSRFTPAAPVPWRLLAVAALALLALALGIALIASGTFRAPAPPYGLAANGAIYYSQAGELYARAANGQAHLVLSGQTNDSDPVLAPDGTKLFFVRHLDGDNVELWSMNANGSNPTRLQIPYAQLSWFEWSPAADAAVLLSDADPRAMTILPIAGGTPSRFDLQVDIAEPFFRPVSGAQLSFLGTDAAGNHGIYLVGRDGSALTRLELDPGFENDQYYDENKCCYFWTQSWSPTGDRLLYTQLEPDPLSPAGPGFRMHLASIGTGGEVLSDRTLEFDRTADDELGGIWLPGQDGMVFQSIEGSTHSLWFAPIAPSGVGPERNLGIDATDWIDFQVSPDGTQMLAIMPAPDGVARTAYLVDIASGTRTQVNLGADATWQRLGR